MISEFPFRQYVLLSVLYPPQSFPSVPTDDNNRTLDL